MDFKHRNYYLTNFPSFDHNSMPTELKEHFNCKVHCRDYRYNGRIYNYCVSVPKSRTNDMISYLENHYINYDRITTEPNYKENIVIFFDPEYWNNKRLIARYPFLRPRNPWTDKLIEDAYWTKLDEMPEGWRKAFGEQMCEEIREALIKNNYLEEYRVTQIKEEYRSLRWYSGAAPQEVHDIVHKYEKLSERICINCGKPATKISLGWISPYCDDCTDDRFHYISIEKYFKVIEEEE